MLRRRTRGLRSLPCSAALLAAIAVATGCGADEEGGGGGLPADQQVRAVVARFGVATRAKDYQQICDQLLSDALVQKIEGIGLPCESALQRGLADVRNPTLSINEVSISGARALVSIHTTATGQAPSDDALQVVREDGDWKIASLASPAGQQGSTTASPATTATPPSTSTSSTTGTTVTSTTTTSTTKTTKNGK